jgi:pimeloyl-ACP methyl ester carboxylesterase
LAKKLGLDVLQVAGSGPGGRVVRQDVEAYAAARERLTEVEAGVSLELLREGEGAPVLFLPGFGTDVSSFATQTQALAERYRVLALNPRGVGHSDAPELPSYPVERAADDAAAVLDEPAHLVGASLGAATAIELALRHPDKVRSLALITPFTTRSARLHAVSEAWAAVAAEAAPETLARFLLPWLFSEDFLTHDTARTRTLRGLTQTVARVPAPTLQRSRAGLESWSGTRTKDLADLCVPTLVLIAGGDLLTPEGEALATAIPDAHTVLIAGAGHALAVEAAESVTRSLREHLEG